MARTVWDNGEGETCLRRFNPRGPPYSISHDRYLPNPPQSDEGDRSRHSGRGFLGAHDNNLDVESEQESQKAANNRRRIPVACGRCRKRKIRCSGPQGDNGCLNCKNAGSSECQFNRVASEEIPFRDNSADFSFPYNQNIAREVQCRPMPTTMYGSSYPSAMMPLNVSLAYRNHPLTNYGYQSKSECYIPSYATEYSDEGVDYSLTGASYPLLGQEQIGVSSSYSSHSPPRGWNTSSNQSIKDSNDAMYFHPNTTPSYPNMSYQSQNYPLRHSVSAESSNFSFQNMASSLPTAPSMTTSTDRVLPMPAANRSNSVSNSGLINLAASADGLPYSVASIKDGNSALSNSSTSMSYLPLPSSLDSIPSYASNCFPAQSQEMYAGTNGSEDWTPKALQAEQSSLRCQDSSSDLYYMATSDKARKTSKIGRGSIAGTLSNGQVYHVPYHQEHLITRKPSLDTAHVAAHRRSNTSLRAA